MLSEFLTSQRETILAKSTSSELKRNGPQPTSDILNEGWQLFYDQLIEVLKRNGIPEGTVETHARKTNSSENAAKRGKEYLLLGYSLSDVVHSYGSICQAITGVANDLDFEISGPDFQQLNLSLDVAIAEAVTEYNILEKERVNESEVQRLGFLAHELRNGLQSATVSLDVIESGAVGTKSKTSEVLRRSLETMTNLVHSTLTEVRLRVEPVAVFEQIKLSSLLREVESNSTMIAHQKGLRLGVESDTSTAVNADCHLLTSALSNLVQNALKFTRPNTTVLVRTKETADRVLIEVEDECGGLPEGKIEELFQPFTQAGFDRTGMGLGLAISRRAVAINNGTVYAKNIPGQGCIFTIDLPKVKDAK